MKYKLKLFFLNLIFLFYFSNLFAQDIHLTNDAKVSIITCASGDELYSLFGHTALRIKDQSSNIDIVYNYGTFDFNTSNFYLKFFKGDLQYMATACSYDEFIQEYIYEQRNVKEQVLNLNPAQKQQLFEKLNSILQSEERFYTYKFIDRNCTTMVVDAINSVIGKNIIELKSTHKKTYREILYPFFENHFFENLGISILFGAKVDEVENHIFLPEDLYKNLNRIKFNQTPICIESNTILNFSPTLPIHSFWNSALILFVLIGILLIINNKVVYQYYFITAGFFGLFLCFAMFYSLHKELLWNYNILLFNPLYILLVFPKSEQLIKMKIYLCKVCLLLVGIFILISWNKAHFIAILPFLGLTIVGLYKIKVWCKKAIDHDKITRY